MAFDVATFFLGMFDDLLAGRLESVAQRDKRVFIRVRITIDDDFIARHVKIDAHVERITLIFVMMRLFNGDIAARQIGMQLLQAVRFLADVFLERCR